MTRHTVDETAFELPPGWQCVTVVSPPATPNEQFASNLVITRDALKNGETLAGYVDRELTDLTKSLKRFALRERREATIGGIPALVLVCTWQGGQGPISSAWRLSHGTRQF